MHANASAGNKVRQVSYFADIPMELGYRSGSSKFHRGTLHRVCSALTRRELVRINRQCRQWKASNRPRDYHEYSHQMKVQSESSVGT